MTAFDPEKFEDKYVHYVNELQAAYKNAYQQVHGRYDATLLYAIDHRVLDESEPFYEGDGEFRIELLEIPINGQRTYPSTTRHSTPSSRSSPTGSNVSRVVASSLRTRDGARESRQQAAGRSVGDLNA